MVLDHLCKRASVLGQRQQRQGIPRDTVFDSGSKSRGIQLPPGGFAVLFVRGLATAGLPGTRFSHHGIRRDFLYGVPPPRELARDASVREPYFAFIRGPRDNPECRARPREKSRGMRALFQPRVLETQCPIATTAMSQTRTNRRTIVFFAMLILYRTS